jgi:hypothetical protein
MRSVRHSALGTGVAAAGHSLVFIGFLQPWVAGQFGARDRLSGLDLARVTDGLIDHGLAGDALTLPVTRVLLFGLPVVAANALLLLALAHGGLLDRRHARHLAGALAIPAFLVAAIALVLLVLTAAGDSVVDGPAFGVVLVAAGALLAIGVWLLELRPTLAAAPAGAEAAPPGSDPAATEA